MNMMEEYEKHEAIIENISTVQQDIQVWKKLKSGKSRQRETITRG
jgi:hypothetical protein